MIKRSVLAAIFCLSIVVVVIVARVSGCTPWRLRSYRSLLLRADVALKASVNGPVVAKLPKGTLIFPPAWNDYGITDLGDAQLHKVYVHLPLEMLDSDVYQYPRDRWKSSNEGSIRILKIDAMQETSRSSGVLIVSECAIRGDVDEDYIRVVLVNNGNIDFVVPASVADQELLMEAVNLKISRWDDEKWVAVSNYWCMDSICDEAALKRLHPGEMISGMIKLKRGAQFILEEGRYFGELNLEWDSWAELLEVPYIDRHYPAAHFLFDVPRASSPNK